LAGIGRLVGGEHVVEAMVLADHYDDVLDRRQRLRRATPRRCHYGRRGRAAAAAGGEQKAECQGGQQSKQRTSGRQSHQSPQTILKFILN